MADEKLGYCRIDSLKLSNKSVTAIKQVREVMEAGDKFTLSLAAVPILDIFLGRKNAADQLIDIAAYDWVEFGEVAKSSSKIVRERIRNIAEPMTWETYGEEGLFWKCVSNAAL